MTTTGQGGPEGPTDLTRQSWAYVARKSVREFMKDECTDLAAALTYYAVLSTFPALIALLALVGVFGQGQSTIDAALDILKQVGADAAAEPAEKILENLINASGAGFALVIGLAVALWSASGYVGSFGRAMNKIYGAPEGRPFWKLRPWMLVVTICIIAMTAVIALGLVLTGPAARAVGDAIGLGDTAVTIWGIVKWPVMLFLMAMIVAILYYATPNVRPPKFRWISVGAVFAIAAWILGSAAFGFYVATFSNYNRTYGALAGAIVFMLWLWITNLALLFGAELDVELERGRQLQSGIPAEEELQIDLRDTSKVEKDEKQEREDVERGRRLREDLADEDANSSSARRRSANTG
jgi:membrane protein